jgi:hypothetical protein
MSQTYQLQLSIYTNLISKEKLESLQYTLLHGQLNNYIVEKLNARAFTCGSNNFSIGIGMSTHGTHIHLEFLLDEIPVDFNDKMSFMFDEESDFSKQLISKIGSYAINIKSICEFTTQITLTYRA